MREEPRRILMTVDALGGVWTYALTLARGLGPLGFSFVLANMGGPPRVEQRRAAAGIPHVELFDGAFRLEWMDEPWADVDAAGDWLLDLTRAWQPDLVHLNGYVHATLPWSAPVLVVAHSCVASWWAAVRGEALPSRFHEYCRRVRAGLQAADHVVAPTRAMLSAVRQHHGNTRQSSVIPNGVEVSSRPRSRDEPKEPRILGVGRLWDAAKNMSALAKVAPEVEWPVRLAGERRDPRGNTATLPGVELLGQLSAAALQDEYARASIFVLPARYEPFGLSALEAALHGCALVLGDIPSLREIWEGAAWFINPDDHDALRGALQRLIDDPAHRAALGGRARERAASFPAPRMIGAYRELYAELLDAPARAPAIHSS